MAVAGNTVTTQGTDGTLHEWDLTGRQGGGIDLPPEVAQGQLSPDGQTLAYARPDGAVGLWNVAKQKETRALRKQPAIAAGFARPSMTFSPDGRFFAQGIDELTVLVWEAASGKRVRQVGPDPVAEAPGAKTVYPRERLVAALALNPDGQTLAMGGFIQRKAFNDQGQEVGLRRTTGFRRPAPRGKHRLCKSGPILGSSRAVNFHRTFHRTKPTKRAPFSA